MNEKAELRLASEPGSAADARRFIRENATLDSMRHAEADLLVTELIGNAVQHSPEADHLIITLDSDKDRGLVVSVSHSHTNGLSDPEPGLGFLLLDRLSKNWAAVHENDTLTVWFCLRTPGTTSLSPDLPDEELFAMMATDPVSSSDELVRRHSDLAASIARRYRGKGIDEDDLVQVANMALLKAIQRYEPSQGSIRPYAAATISGELKRLLRDRGWSVRVPRSLQERALEVSRTADELSQTLNREPEPSELAERLEMTEDEVIEALVARRAYASSSMEEQSEDGGATLRDRLEDEDIGLLMADQRLMVEGAMSSLPERQRRILDLRFNEDMTQAEIAEEIGISQMHVSRLLSKALATLERTIGSDQDTI
ncbi:MAG TPA: sigma-70 family RNA polymerase sigma factor [Acidimicrobiia bacterium]|nr:sigma-70 family RNA polymerase sigma factor [Acidimicrobiia bacterium]